MRRSKVGLFLGLLGCVAAQHAFAAAPVFPKNLKKYQSQYYDIYTDVAPEEAREVVLRMTKMAEEYHARTQNLFRGQMHDRLPFYLFSDADAYYAAGALPGSGGVFIVDQSGARLMAIATRDQNGHLGGSMWHTIQHEGFHQFVYYVVRGPIPPWVNEGMAEFFGEGIFTGDGMITGVIPPGRCRAVKQQIKEGTFVSLQRMMRMSQAMWNLKLQSANYDQAWSMCQFLAFGDNGKYQNAFTAFMQDIGRGLQWDQAWASTFGDANGFEDRWKTYWLNLPDDATKSLYEKAIVATLTSFYARACSQNQTFASVDDFLDTDYADLKHNPADWLPASLYETIQPVAQRMSKGGYTFAFAGEKRKLPTLTCVTPDGEKFVGSFHFISAPGGLRVAGVTTESVSPAVLQKP